jgi:hypothetical protein
LSVAPINAARSAAVPDDFANVVIAPKYSDNVAEAFWLAEPTAAVTFATASFNNDCADAALCAEAVFLSVASALRALITTPSRSAPLVY